MTTTDDAHDAVAVARTMPCNAMPCNAALRVDPTLGWADPATTPPPTLVSAKAGS